MPHTSNRPRRLVLGVSLLLLVDLIWVLSNELTKFLYQNESFDKPFFCTFFKTSMFTIYLAAYAFLAPWRDAQNLQAAATAPMPADSGGPTAVAFSDNNRASGSRRYTRLAADDDDNNEITQFETTMGGADHGTDTVSVADTSLERENASRLSESIFVPIKDASGAVDEELSHTCDHAGGGGMTRAESSSEEESSVRSVRFNKMAEVREMSPLEASEALMARLSYTASLRIRRQKSHHKTARTALLFAVLWFIANYLYQLALVPGEAALVTVLSSTSSLFTLALAAIFPSTAGDKFTLSKCLAVFLSIGGVTLISWSEVNTDDKKMARGIFMAIMSAFFYAAYLVLVKRKSDTEEKINIPLFFGFVGLWSCLIMWPLFLLLNFSHVEPFEWPNRRQFLILFLNGLVGTVASEALWLWGCFLTSSLIGTLTITLQIPLAMLMDVLIRGKTYPLMFYLGSIPVAVSVLFVAVLLKYEDSDPVLVLFKLGYRKLFQMRWRQQVLRVHNNYDDDEQQESLINGAEDEDGHNQSATH